MQVECQAESLAHRNVVKQLDALSVTNWICELAKPKLVADADIVPSDPKPIVFSSLQGTVAADSKGQAPLDWIGISVGYSSFAKQAPATFAVAWVLP